MQPLWDEGPLIAAHALAAMLALGLAVWQVLGAKGSPRHKVMGYIWAGLMLFIAGGSFWIHTLEVIGPWSPIHLLSILVMVTVPLAVLHARRGRIRSHARAMTQLFVLALIGAGIFTLWPGRVMHAVVFG
jgi:uncharacterized membrane protein